MPLPPVVGSDTQLQNLIDRALEGDTAAHEALLNHACDRLLRLTRKMFHGYPNLRRWEQTDDVFQNSMIRLHRALADGRNCVSKVRMFRRWNCAKDVCILLMNLNTASRR